MSQLVNKAQLAEIMGTSLPTIAAWTREGMPFEQKGSAGKSYVYRTADAIEWRLARAVAKALEKGPVPSGIENFHQLALERLLALHEHLIPKLCCESDPARVRTLLEDVTFEAFD